MNPFQRVQRDVRQDQIDREILLSNPPEFFQTALGGNPNPAECIHLVETLVRTLATLEVYVNDVYYVRVRKVEPYIHLAIGRHDGKPCTNWREFQQIKNELIGPEFEAVELFPAESRLMDTANEYHLYAMSDSKFRFPFGFHKRCVIENPPSYRGTLGIGPVPPLQPTPSMDSAVAALSHC
jgi:hypothetical protein